MCHVKVIHVAVGHTNERVVEFSIDTASIHDYEISWTQVEVKLIANKYLLHSLHQRKPRAAGVCA